MYKFGVTVVLQRATNMYPQYLIFHMGIISSKIAIANYLRVLSLLSQEYDELWRTPFITYTLGYAQSDTERGEIKQFKGHKWRVLSARQGTIMEKSSAPFSL